MGALLPQAVFIDEDTAGASGPRTVSTELSRRLLELRPRAAAIAVVNLHPEIFSETFQPHLDQGMELVAFSTSGVYANGRVREGLPAAAALCFGEGVTVAGFDPQGLPRGEAPPATARNAVVFATPKLTNIDALTGVLRCFEGEQGPFTGGFVMEDTMGRGWVWDRYGVHDDGFVALLCQTPGAVGMSQGMRLLGEAFLITQAKGRWLEQLAFQPALGRLETALREAEDTVEAQLFVGFPLRQQSDMTDPEQFIAYPVMGVDRERGALRLPMEVPMGQPAHFMAKNARDALAGLQTLGARLCQGPAPPAWALVTSCCARNGRFYGAEGSDAVAAQRAFENVPHVGWYANGEFAHGPEGLQLVQFSAVVNTGG